MDGVCDPSYLPARVASAWHNPPMIWFILGLALFLIGCTGVVDVSALGGVHTLNLTGSNYAETTADGIESGCANAGAGCHGG